MTVTYTSEVTTSTGFGCFLKLLARWRGSIYKLVWADLLLFMVLYYSINLTYRLALDKDQKLVFEKIVNYCEKYGNLIPLSFVLGFYVNIVMTRWWNQYNSIPFPDNLALLVSASVKGESNRGRVVRRTIMRYVCLSFAMTLRLISPKIKKRFPTLDHLVEAGLLERDEKKILENTEREFPSYSKNWLPLVWASNIVTRARHEGMIRDDPSVDHILEEINRFRTKCGGLLDYDWISIPLVYTQVVTLAVYTYFITTLFGRQWIEPRKDDDIDLYFPFLTVLEFFFYMGWLRVAETLINPFGDDDDDFEVVWMVDRHVQVTYLIVDKIHYEHPKLMKDQHWKEMAPHQLPHTSASEQFKYEHPVYSTDLIDIKGTDAEVLLPDGQRKSMEIVDGQGLHPTGSLLRRIFHRNPRIATTTELHSINAETEGMRDEVLENQIEDDENGTTDADNDYSDFDNLKKIRNLLMKQRIVKYLEALKEETKKEKMESLVDEVLKGAS